MSKSQIAWWCAQLLCVGVGVSACTGSPPEESPRASRESTWEHFLSQVHQEPGSGVYIANGDEPFSDVTQLRAFYDAHVNTANVGTRQDGLAIMVRNGARARWTEAEKHHLSYCVSTAFGTRHATVVQAMSDAARAWEAAADVRFVHLSEFDSNCTASQLSVVFDVRPVSGGAYFARAFFPGDARAVSNVLIDESSVGRTRSPSLTGILRHELGHTLGFRHEHTRPEAGTCFEDSRWEALTSYDAASVMHYPTCNGTEGWSFTLSPLDIAGARAAYELPNRIGILRPSGLAYIQEQGRGTTWTLVASDVQALALGSDRIGIIKTDGNVYVKEGSLGAAWMWQTSNTQALSLAGDRIGVLHHDGIVYVKEGRLDANWAQVRSDARAIALAGDRIGVLGNDGQVHVKQGGLGADWVWQTSNTQALALTDTRIGVVHNDGNVFVKEGDLGTNWVWQAANTQAISLSGNRIGALYTDGNVHVKEGGLDAAWVWETSITRVLSLSGDRIGALHNNGDVYVKQGGLSTNWTLVTSGATDLVLSTP
ncbi:hypothetical protein LXT21_33515 [Myxococcus sp. K38C18041901]|uniref:matrixin family metalloprotease n=1 Tax=Myxococcus guangdongensis TaxID=2906760 RepID=UPI0020A6DC9D|nr:matrixin family metalloprotease [Myxococcus guangdongensis]MCP3063704.1 hypothetical protein [Myxococcus guangdongensis]